jgi:hypothetical protein
MKTTLTEKQREVLALLKAGWRLNDNGDGMSRDGQYQTVPYKTSKRLYDLGLIDSDHRLTTKGREAV